MNTPPLRTLIRAFRSLLLVLAALLTWHGLATAQPAQSAPRWTGFSATAFKHTMGPIWGGNAIVQDHSGFLWLGTQTGLLRWDGYSTRRYTSDSRRPRALPDSFVRTVHVDQRGTLWVGTSSGGLARYDAGSDDFTVFPPGPAGLGNANVTGFADDGAGGLWIGTASGLDHMSAEGKLSHPSDRVFPSQTQGLERAVQDLRRDRSGALWIGTRKGLLRLAPGAASAVPVSFSAEGEVPPVTSLFEDSTARMWIGTRMGAYVMQAGAASAVPVVESGAAPAMHKERVLSIVEVSPSEIWFGTEGGGIVALNPDSGNTHRIRHHADAPDSLYDNDVYALYRERSGVIVAGSTEAVSIHDPRPQAMVTVRQTGLPADGKLTIQSILVRPDGKIWIGVGGGSIDILDPQLGGVARIAAGAPGGLRNGRVLSMVNAADGSVYAGTQQGLYRISGDGKQVRQVQVPQRSATAPALVLAWRDGVLWLGGTDGVWALRFGAAGAPPAVLRREDGALGDNRVSALLPTADGGLWIGTRGGLAYLASVTAKLELVTPEAGASDSLLPGFMSSLSLDRTGRLWVSTFGRGIQILERTDADGRRRFRRLSASDGLPDLSVNAVLADRAGMMWASTDNGLARIDPGTFAVRPLGRADGAHIGQYWTNSAALSTEGELLFGGLTGLSVVRPEKLAPINYLAPLVVTDISLGDKAFAPGQYHQGPGAAAPAPVTITPAGKERGFSLEFAALDYSAPERMRYSYRLAGFDSDWIDASAGSRRVGYNNLPPGSYNLELRAANGAGGWSPALSVPVRALPAWHQLDWVRALAVLLGLGGVAWLVQFRTAYLRRRQVELEGMVEQRTAELRASQAQLVQFAYADPLTGLPNRRLFNDELRGMKALAARAGTPFTLLLIDLDHFKQVNDTLGHDAGDALLVEVARRLRVAVRETDRLARLGGDEFAVLLSNTDTDADIALVARRIIDGVATPITFGEHSMHVGASIGAARCSGAGNAEADLYKQADLALYQAKHSGRNRWVSYRPVESGAYEGATI